MFYEMFDPSQSAISTTWQALSWSFATETAGEAADLSAADPQFEHSTAPGAMQRCDSYITTLRTHHTPDESPIRCTIHHKLPDVILEQKVLYLGSLQGLYESVEFSPLKEGISDGHHTTRACKLDSTTSVLV
jgi:hypothetical protein